MIKKKTNIYYYLEIYKTNLQYIKFKKKKYSFTFLVLKTWKEDTFLVSRVLNSGLASASDGLLWVSLKPDFEVLAWKQSFWDRVNRLFQLL